MNRELIKQAIKALESCYDVTEYPCNGKTFQDETIRALKNELENPSDEEKPQMCLGDLINALELLPPDSFVSNLNTPHSYRGYYNELAFELDIGTRMVSDLLEECRNCVGKHYEGYKGGQYCMGYMTPVWIAAYGETGREIIGVNPNGLVLTRYEE